MKIGKLLLLLEAPGRYASRIIEHDDQDTGMHESPRKRDEHAPHAFGIGPGFAVSGRSDSVRITVQRAHLLWLVPLTGFLKSSAREVTGMENATTRQVINKVKKLLILIIGTSS
jgi:hypothetical protein